MIFCPACKKIGATALAAASRARKVASSFKIRLCVMRGGTIAASKARCSMRMVDSRKASRTRARVGSKPSSFIPSWYSGSSTFRNSATSELRTSSFTPRPTAIICSVRDTGASARTAATCAGRGSSVAATVAKRSKRLSTRCRICGKTALSWSYTLPTPCLADCLKASVVCLSCTFLGAPTKERLACPTFISTPSGTNCVVSMKPTVR